ncbi:hypothetical protein [Legionella yabuuchiae]|uniref:hypothetical protein n=1 Tax=Legionella yabuuchiae TaxID=376727 RepID=UPI001056E009|nr:hypothetical protein [Legionella yabuuchiae]
MFIKEGILLSILIALGGCQSIGPKILDNDRYSYNMALYHSRNKELLLNIVRLRYDHPPIVLSVGNISGSTKIQREGRLEVYSKLFTPSNATETKAEGSTGLVYSDNPIISYTPLDDQIFHARFLSALNLRQIGLLLESSWSIERVFQVTIQQAGAVTNATSAARPTSRYVPRYQRFINMVYVLRRLQLKDAFVTTYTNKDERETLTLNLNQNAILTEHEKKILNQAGVKLYHNKIMFTNYEGPHATPVITRSVLGIFNYLSKGVLIPPNDAENGIVTITRYPNGKSFDWQKVLEGVITIKHCEKQPTHAMVAIPYLNRWYYIDDRDAYSKQTLMMLTNIIGLISGPVPSSPVGITRNA